jgi:REP element-mobilizing transposase RayT
MAGTFSQICIHLVIVVKYREYLIKPEWEEELYKYMTGIIQGKNQKLIEINGMPDHIHILIVLKPNMRLDDLVRELKKSTTAFIQQNGFSNKLFRWQSGYGAFSHSKGNLNTVINYIKNQKSHHKKTSLREEYMEMLQESGIEYDEKYLFDTFD